MCFETNIFCMDFKILFQIFQKNLKGSDSTIPYIASGRGDAGHSFKCGV